MPLRCVIIDDNPSLLEAASALLEREGIAVVGVASTPDEAVRMVDELRPDLTLVDIDLGEWSGFDLVRRLVNGAPQGHAGSILISTHSAADFPALTAASPALGFVHKSALSAEAIYAIVNASEERR